MPPSELAEIIDGLQSLIGRQSVSEEYVRFRIELLRAQTAVRDELARSAVCRATEAASDDNVSPLGPHDVPLDQALLAKLLGELSAALDSGKQQTGNLQRLCTAANQDPGLLAELARQAAFRPHDAPLVSLVKRAAIDFDALLFFGRALGAPFVTEVASRRRYTEATLPGCPWCGSPPGLAKLNRKEGREGRRVLFCSLCGQDWQFGRVACAFCAAQAGAEVLSLTPADPCTIEVCNQCQCYLKTVDERKLPDDYSVVPLVETTATLYLDLIAEEKGYARALPYTALH